MGSEKRVSGAMKGLKRKGNSAAVG